MMRDHLHTHSGENTEHDSLNILISFGTRMVVYPLLNTPGPGRIFQSEQFFWENLETQALDK